MKVYSGALKMLVLNGVDITSNKMSNEKLLDLLIYAASNNNEFDNHDKVDYYRNQVLIRMRK